MHFAESMEGGRDFLTCFESKGDWHNNISGSIQIKTSQQISAAIQKWRVLDNNNKWNGEMYK